MDSTRDLFVALARRYAFADLGALAPAAEIAEVCEFGQRLLSLDAEDFAAEARVVPADLRRRARACHMPQTPREQPRGRWSRCVRRTGCCWRSSPYGGTGAS
ncbi:hypothetical protein ACFQ0B_26175 [Nonomuraea thailandensis]